MPFTIRAWVGRMPVLGQWGVLGGLSALFVGVLAWSGLPAALLMGPLLAAVVMAAGGGGLRVPRIPLILAQGLLGCLIARMLPNLLGTAVPGNGFVLAFGVLSVIVATLLFAWLVTRLRLLPGSAALWGLSPGAATVMTLMAEAHGTDAQLVAFMQYLRVVIVAAIASCMAMAGGGPAAMAAHPTIWFPPVHWPALGETVLLAVGGSLIGSRLRLRTAALLLPLGLAVILAHAGWLTLELPPWLIAFAYAAIGWRIGLRFTPGLIGHVVRMLPRVLLCILGLVVICAGLGAVVSMTAGVDPLTAYLATSPGGADTVAIITASTHADARFVMTMQMARFLAVLLLVPPVTRFVSRYRPLKR